MATNIETARPEDRDELLAFMNHAFGKTGDRRFETITARLVEPEMMPSYYIIRQNGRIVADAGVFHFDMQVGSEVLHLAGIGNVACDPQCRGQGLMSTLMTSIHNTLQQAGCDASVLGGQRQRYRYFGWERMGVKVEFQLTPASVNHGLKQRDEVSIIPFDLTDAGLIAAAKKLHDAQPAHVIRPESQFAGHLTQWASRPCAAVDRAGRLVGYAVTDLTGNYATELLAESTEIACVMIAHFTQQAVDRGEGVFRIITGAFHTPMFRTLLAESESWTVMTSGNWNMGPLSEKAANAFLKLRHAMTPLPAGRVSLGVGSADPDAGVTMRVDGNGASVKRERSAADYCFADQAEMGRVLFGPMGTTAAGPDLPALLNVWCPLPLYLSRQDGV